MRYLDLGLVAMVIGIMSSWVAWWACVLGRAGRSKSAGRRESVGQEVGCDREIKKGENGVPRNSTETRPLEVGSNASLCERALEFSPTAVLMTDRGGCVTYVNAAWEQMSGFTRTEIVGRNLDTLKSGVHTREFYSQLWQQLRAGRQWRGEFCNHRKDGSLYWVSSAIGPVYALDGSITHFVATNEDISHYKRQTEESFKLREAADAADRAKATFLAKVSEEIRVPLNSIQWHARTLEEGAGLTARQQEALRRILCEGDHLFTILNEVLGMSRIEAGRDCFQSGVCGLERLLDELEQLYQLRAQSRGVRFVMTRGVDLPRFVMGDEAKLRQVMVQLLGQALGAASRGDRVELIVRVDTEPLRPGLNRLWIEAMGPMTSEASEVKLLREPMRCGAALGDRLGTGVSLSSGRELVRVMGGDMMETLESGLGRVVRVAVPVAKVPEAEACGLNPEPKRVWRILTPSTPVRVLVVDDYAPTLTLFRDLLEPIGFEVRTATDGLEALAYPDDWIPRVILMDMYMPVMDGHEAIRAFRSRFGDTLSIITISASMQAEDRDNSLLAGADAFLSKPFRSWEVLDLIRRLVGVEYVYGTSQETQAGEGLGWT